MQQAHILARLHPYFDEISYNGKIVPTAFASTAEEENWTYDRQSPRATVRLSLKVHLSSISIVVREF